eukprot:scaffold116582_cov37-Phaeocystis_antarctica.AAC.1
MSSYLRAAGGMRRASLGSGYRCITHRVCPGKQPKSQDQLRPPRLRHVDEHATHGSRAALQLVVGFELLPPCDILLRLRQWEPEL